MNESHNNVSRTQGSLQQLISAAQSGDEQAQNALMQRCRSYLHLIARTQLQSWLQRKVDASDLVQETMLDAHQGFAKFRGKTEGEWLAWLKQILTHNMADFVRQYRAGTKRDINKERPILSPVRSTQFPLQISQDDPSPSENIIAIEQQIRIAEAIAQLPEDYQQVIQLRNLDALPFAEIAVLMQRTRPAVQMLWLRALRKLKDQLDLDTAG